MRKQEELTREHERLLEAGDFDAANQVLKLLEPLSDDQWRRQLELAPLEDETLSPVEIQRFEEFEVFLAAQARREAG